MPSIIYFTYLLFSFILSDNCISLRLLHDMNTKLPIEDTEFGILIFSKFTHPENALLPIKKIPFGMTKCLRAVQLAKE